MVPSKLQHTVASQMCFCPTDIVKCLLSDYVCTMVVVKMFDGLSSQMEHLKRKDPCRC